MCIPDGPMPGLVTKPMPESVYCFSAKHKKLRPLPSNVFNPTMVQSSPRTSQSESGLPTGTQEPEPPMTMRIWNALIGPYS